MFRIKGIFHILIFILLITISGPQATSQKDPSFYFSSALTVTQKPQDQVWMTIFIHGSITYMIRPPGPALILKLIKDTTEGTLYEDATRIIRNNSFFTKTQPMQGMGLKKIEKNKNSCFPATIIANIFDQLDHWQNGRTSNKNLYYTYGWSGIVGWNARYNETKQLYKDLSKEIKQLNEIGVTPKIRIIGFCHGASLGINLALVRQKEQLDFTFDIDELILMSMPINKTMNPLLHSSMFKKIYSLYSMNDWIQRFDLLAPGGLFTRRLFIPRKKEHIPKKVKQIRIQIMQNKKIKKSWPKEKDPRYQFNDLSIIDGTSHLLKDMSPSHLEQWFFGWVDRSYRHNFPLFPLPVLSIVPVIINAIDKHETDSHGCCTADIRPDQQTIIIKGGQTYTIKRILPGLRNFSELLSLIPQPQPERGTKQEYQRQAQLCIQQAKQKRQKNKRKTSS